MVILKVLRPGHCGTVHVEAFVEGWPGLFRRSVQDHIVHVVKVPGHAWALFVQSCIGSCMAWCLLWSGEYSCASSLGIRCECGYGACQTCAP